MTINDNIRRLRLEKHLSQEKLGELLGVSGQAVSKWEQGITSPDISLVPIIAECFGVTIDSLFDGMDVRKYPGYQSERNELLAMYIRPEGSEKDFENAVEAFNEVILNGRASTEDFISCGILHKVHALREIELALYYYRRAISEGNEVRDVQWMCAHQVLTNLLADIGRVEEAVEEHRKWRDTEPEDAWAHVSYSYALVRAGRLEEAWEEIKVALKLNVEDANVRTAAGDLCAKLGYYEEAVQHWDKAFKLDSTSISCLFSKAEMYVTIGENKKAIAQYEDILDWLEKHGYNMDIEGRYPRRRIDELLLLS